MASDRTVNSIYVRHFAKKAIPSFLNPKNIIRIRWIPNVYFHFL